uniref:Uncharacterized protein n=2 Tax=Oryza punctata TaxID=4537 RepID=A0A0E0K6L5_ORYPU
MLPDNRPIEYLFLRLNAAQVSSSTPPTRSPCVKQVSARRPAAGTLSSGAAAGVVGGDLTLRCRRLTWCLPEALRSFHPLGAVRHALRRLFLLRRRLPLVWDDRFPSLDDQLWECDGPDPYTAVFREKLLHDNPM